MFYSNSHHAFPDKLCGFRMFQTIFKSSEDKMNYDHGKTCAVCATQCANKWGQHNFE